MADISCEDMRLGAASNYQVVSMEWLVNRFLGYLNVGTWTVWWMKSHIKGMCAASEGYERLAHAREGGSRSTTNDRHELTSGEDMFSDGVMAGTGIDSLPANDITAKVASIDNDDDAFDMFGDEDESTVTHRHSETLSSEPPPEPGSLQDLQSEKASEGYETDYVFDESSGYYYSSNLGYYYDPTSGLYCCAASGKWFSFNEQTSTYDEVLADGSRQTAEPIIRS